MPPQSNATRRQRKSLDPLFAEAFQTSPNKGDLMKEQIIRSAIHCIATKGIEATTFESIGKPLKIRKSHVAYHFKEKEDIIAAAIRYVIAVGQKMTIARMQAANTPRQKAMAMFEAFYDWAEGDPEGMAVYHLFFYYCATNEKYRSLHAEMREVGVKRFATILIEDAKWSKNRTRAEIETLAKIFQAIAFGSLTDMVTTSKITPALIKEAKARAEVAVAAILDR